MKIVPISLKFLILIMLLSHCSLYKQETKNSSHIPSGSIVIYTSMYPQIIETVQQRLAAKFPQLKIEFLYQSTKSFQSMITSEMRSGRVKCDMLIIADTSYAFELKKQGLLHPYRSRYIQSLALPYDRDGYWYPVRISNMVLAYNPEKTHPDMIAHSFKEFAEKESLCGEISMSDPRVSGTAFTSLLSLYDAYGEDFFINLKKQNVILEPSSKAIEKLEHGEYRQIMVLEEAILKKRQQEASPLEVIYPEDGTIMIPSPIMTIAVDKSASRNIKSCEAITDWFLSEEGQRAIVDCWMHSISKKPVCYPFYSHASPEIRENSMPIDWKKGYTRHGTITQLFRDYPNRYKAE